ncbi:DUF927 domain-containing protein [Lysinibacillus fusiformis]|uniref:DUF927 domain-containing protein n=1 Tax=Lysinibacillus fusiformis TaxID=28031 RepID=UPI0019679375|nr:DUF927 domain-containing protein [Lysinibacillus fusiformis]QSB11702.1 DUF927 domain-containing protein [Lysinibacillus fusiformis]
MVSTRMKATLIDKENPILNQFRKELTIRKFIVKNNCLYLLKKNDDGEVSNEYVCRLIWLNRIVVDKETNQVKLELIYHYLQRYHKITIPRSMFADKKLQALTEFGVDVPILKVGHIISFLSMLEDDMRESIDYSHNTIGWEQDEAGNLAFKHYHFITASKQISQYNGFLDIKPSGTLEGWIDLMKAEVQGKTPLEFAMILGFSAPVNALLAMWSPMEVLMVHIAGESSTGKTTSTRIAVSSFGKPDHNGLIRNWNSTGNAQLKLVADNFGVPITLDEASSKTQGDFTTIIYQLAEGQDKSRLTKESEMKEQATWNTTIISTAEHKLTEKSAKNNGITVRLPEFVNKTWTESADHAQALKVGVSEHYGHSGVFFVKFLLAHAQQKEDILQKYTKWKKEFEENFIVKDEFSGRLAEKYAIILLTAELFNQCFKQYQLNVNLEALFQFVLENDAETAGTRTLDAKAIDVIKQFVVRHHVRFERDGQSHEGLEYYGTIKTKDTYLEVGILKSTLETELKAQGFSSFDTVMKQLKSNGYLNAEQGKHTRKRKLNGEERATLVILKLDKELLSSLSNTTEATPKPKPINKDSKLSSLVNRKRDTQKEIEEMLEDE